MTRRQLSSKRMTHDVAARKTLCTSAADSRPASFTTTTTVCTISVEQQGRLLLTVKIKLRTFMKELKA